MLPGFFLPLLEAKEEGTRGKEKAPSFFTTALNMTLLFQKKKKKKNIYTFCLRVPLDYAVTYPAYSQAIGTGNNILPASWLKECSRNFLPEHNHLKLDPNFTGVQSAI